MQDSIRVRQYKNHWSISLNKWDVKTQASLSKWAVVAKDIPNSGIYADIVISTTGGIKFNYTVKDLYSLITR